jgi:hypothetical protein
MFGYVIELPFFNLTKGKKSKNTTCWSSITLENPSYSMRHNAVPITKQEKPPWFPMNTIGKPRGAWPTFVSFPRTHAFQGDGLGLSIVMLQPLGMNQA